MITFEGVRYRYPRQARPALDGLDWQVDEGQFVLVTGPSGSGKSTLVRCLNGLVPQFHGGAFGGTVLVDGRDTRRHTTAALSRSVGFVAQDPESQTVTDRVEDEIAFGPECAGLDRSEIRLRVEEALDLLGIAHLRRRELATLSGGERQRVVIAAAMALRPRLLVLDEPTSQLDPWGAEEVLTVLERLNSDLGMTIVLVEHRLERVLGTADRLVLVEPPGRIAADGTTVAVVDRLPEPPPLVRLARTFGWRPAPLTVRDARRARAEYGPADALLAEPVDAPLPERRATVELERVSYAFGATPVLHDVSLAFHAGAVTALMGRNGSGKTTLLKQINGLLRPSSGLVRVLGADIGGRDTADVAASIGYLPQNPRALLFNDTLAAELDFTLRCRRARGDVAGTLAAVGLAGLEGRNPLELAGGERQRAALAAVAVGRPPILLLDEPTRGMDAARKRELGMLLRRFAAEGMTVVLATHDVELVASSADRVVLLGDGQIIADASPRTVLAGSLVFATQTNRVFGGRFLTVEDVTNRARTNMSDDE